MAQGGSYLDIFPSLSSTSYSNKQNTKKNLLDQFGDETKVESEETISVYLRIKPTVQNTGCEEQTLEIFDSKTLVTKAPEELSALKKRIGKQEECRFTFTHILGPDVQQQELFERCIEEPVRHFLSGYNFLIFSYGTSSAGKTYTVQGTKSHPGLIPRALHLVFHTINDCQSEELEYRPNGNSVVRMTEQDKKNHAELKHIIVNGNEDGNMDDMGPSKSTHYSLTSLPEIEQAYRCMEKILDDEMKSIPLPAAEKRYSMWICYIEVYNEAIYDLLQPLPFNKQRKQLKLADDKSKSSFVKDLSYINVNTGEEAYKVMMHGKNNLQIASTGMNKWSSRSHCIFTMMLVQTSTASDSENMILSRFSICDLAGAERQKTTHNIGDRLKESQHINCSLHVLSRCFDIIRDNQLRTEKLVIPYRESKLTRLFQKALGGEEKVIMLVNVNPAVSFEETQQVLKTSAIARKIIAPVRPVRKKKRRSRSKLFTTALAEHHRQTGSKWDDFSDYCMPFEAIYEGPSTSDFGQTRCQVPSVGSQQVVDSLLSTIETQKKKLENVKASLEEQKEANVNLELKLRAHLSDEYGKLITNIEEKYKTRIAAERSKLKELVQWKNQYEMNTKKRKRDLDYNFDEAAFSIIDQGSPTRYGQDQIREEELNLLRNENIKLKSSAICFKENNDKLNDENSKLKFQLMNEADTILKLKSAIENEEVQNVLELMDKMKSELNCKIDEKTTLLAEAFEEIKDHEKEKAELLSTNSELEGKLEGMEIEVEDTKRKLRISEQMVLQKVEEIEILERNVDNLLEFVDLKEDELKVAKEKCDECQNKNEMLKTDLSELQRKYDELEEQLRNREIRVKELEEQSGVARNEIAEIDRLQRVIDLTEKEHSDYKRKLEDELFKVNEISVENKKRLLKKVELKEKELDEMGEQLSKCIEKYDEVHGKLQKTIEANGREKNLILEQITEHRKENEKYKNDLSKYFEKEQRLQAQDKALKQSADTIVVLTDKNEELEKECSKLDKRLTEMEKQLQGTVELKNRETDEMNKRLDALLTENCKLKEECVKSETKLKELEERLQRDVEVKQRELKEMELQVADYRKENGKLKLEFIKFDEKCTAYEKSLETYQRKDVLNEKLKVEISKLEERYAEKERQLQHSTRTKESEVGELANQVKKYTEENKKLIKEQARLEERILEYEQNKDKELKENSSRMKEYQTEYVKATAELAKFEGKCSEIEKRFQEKVEIKERELKDTMAQLAEHLEENRKLKADLAEFQVKFIEYERTLESHQSQSKTIKEITKKMVAYQSQNELLKDELCKTERKFAEIEESLCGGSDGCTAVGRRGTRTASVREYREEAVMLETAEASGSQESVSKSQDSPILSDESTKSLPETSTKQMTTRSRRTKTAVKKEIPPHAEILAQVEPSCSVEPKSVKKEGKRKLFGTSSTSQEMDISGLVADDPNVHSESPVSTMNRLTQSQPRRTLRNRRKKD